MQYGNNEPVKSVVCLNKERLALCTDNGIEIFDRETA